MLVIGGCFLRISNKGNMCMSSPLPGSHGGIVRDAGGDSLGMAPSCVMHFTSLTSGKHVTPCAN